MKAMMAFGAALCAGAMLLAASGCGDSNAGSEETPGAVTTPQGTSVASTPAEGQPTWGPDELTAVAAGPDAQLVPYADPGGRYNVAVPFGWERDEARDSLTLAMPGDPVAATLGIFCQPGLTWDGLLDQDQRTFDAASLPRIPTNDVKETTVAGYDAHEIRFNAEFGQNTLQRVFLYFEAGECAWRIQMTVFPGYSFEDFVPLLDRFTASFELAQGD